MKKNIKEKLEKIDKDYYSLLLEIGKAAHEEKLKVYLVGGMIRDLLLGFDNLDIDIVVESNALQLAEALTKKFPNSELSAKHDRFHTAKLIFNLNGKKVPVDLASTRQEIYEHSAALPTVTISDLKKDLYRRDFTINALAASLLPEDFGEIVDLFNGLTDLKNKKIKVLHDASFIDDPTRMIRAVRFACKLGFTIEENTEKFLKTAIESKKFDNLIETIRGDRVKIETRYFLRQVKGMFTESNIKSIVDKLIDSKVYKLISTNLKFNVLPELWNATKYIPGKYENQWLIYFALFMKHLDHEKQFNIMKNLQLTGNEISIIDKAFAVHNRLTNSQQIDSIIIYKELGGLPFESIILIESLFAQDKKIFPLVSEYLEKTSKIRLEMTGQDLINIGIKEGKMIGEVLNKVLEKKIKNPLMNKQDEIKEANEILKTIKL
ncbi:MAG: CCA tRNA nucleotidyltransferase [Candidatus Melainabacteria bacterium]|nr:CCA tRNA nucleotidyltransferase [Candidatus Melainabacteria bacterium]